MKASTISRVRIDEPWSLPGLVLLVLGIGDDLKKFGISVGTTAVFRRTSTFTGDTPRVLAFLCRLEAFMHEHVLPRDASRS